MVDCTVSPEKLHYFVNDHHGQPQQTFTFKPDGNITGTTEINSDAYGGTYGHYTTGLTQPLRQLGHYADQETGYQYNGFRTRDPFGEYIERDPIGLAGGINAFAYANQNPVMNVDPDGLKIIVNGSVEFQRDYRAARSYLKKAGQWGHLQEIDDDDSVTLCINETDGAMWSGLTGLTEAGISWNRRSGLVTETGDVQSPALGLFHEGEHMYLKYSDAGLSETEEEKAVIASETIAANALGEPTRFSHTNLNNVTLKTISVSSPTYSKRSK